MANRVTFHEPAVGGTKVCFKCDEEKPHEEFKPDKRMADGRHSWCVECWRAYHRAAYAKAMQDPKKKARRRATGARSARKTRAANPSTSRFHTIKYRYGLTQEQYEAMLTAQGGTCANPACDSEPTHVDHDHACCPARTGKGCGKCVRGLLCAPCNHALGRVEDSVERLQGLINYLSIGQRLKDTL